MNNKFYAQIEAFVFIVRCNSITDAALELKTTKSNISQKLSDLELALDAVLLQRTTRHMELTPAGKHAYDICQAAVDATSLAALKIGAMIQKEGRLAGKVKISGSNTYLTKCVLPVMRGFKEKYPDIETTIIGSDRRVDFAVENVDLGFRIGTIQKTRDKVTSLKPLDRILCASPKMLNRYGVLTSPSDLANIPCVLREQENPVWSLQKGGIQYRHHITDPSILANTVELSLEASINGLGVCLIAEVVARDAIESGHLVQVLQNWSIEVIPVALVSRHSRLCQPHVNVLQQYLCSMLS